ncbi:MAG: hypothetical protein RL095_3393 [Verrucomicrobiota bacterium]|jgi:single-stranded-DNA-specific exonuclease
MKNTISSARWIIHQQDEEALDAFRLRCPVSEALARSLMRRGMDPARVESAFGSSLSALTDPYRLPGMAACVERLWLAITRGDKIAVHGDYDTDGVTSSVLLNWFLRAYGAHCEVFVSNRMDDGYGPTPNTVDRLFEKGVRLIISTDCGITSFEAAERCDQLGIDFIITDHHIPASRLPAARAIVNPRLDPSLVDLQGLAGVGVAFKVCHALAKHGVLNGVNEPVDLREGLDLVALGTVADLAPLTGENRALVRTGLRLLSGRVRPGIRALVENCRIDGKITANDICRRLAPKINAAGRVGDPMVSVHLLQEKDINAALEMADILDRYNRRRRLAEREAMLEACAEAERQLPAQPPMLLIVGKGWHPGVVGLLATKISKLHMLPALVLSDDAGGQLLVGSGRSGGGTSILEGLRACEDLLTTYGGHPMAAGVSLAADKIDEFRRRLLEFFRHRCLDTTAPQEEIHADATMDLTDLGDDFFADLERLEPFGVGNPEPTYHFRKLLFSEVMSVGDEVVRGSSCDSQGTQMQFVTYTHDLSQFVPGRLMDAMASPRTVWLNGRPVRQLLVHDMRPSEIADAPAE